MNIMGLFQVAALQIFCRGTPLEDAVDIDMALVECAVMKAGMENLERT